MRRLAVGLVAVSACATALAGAPVALADDPLTITGGQGDWGVKESFRNYIQGPIAHGSITTSGGATTNADGTFRFPVTGGSYDAATATGEVRFAGTVLFTGHDQGAGPLLQMQISNPRVELAGAGGTLFADVESKSLSTGEVEQYPDVDFASLDLTGIEPVVGEDEIGWTAIPATLTEAGAPAFAGFYPAGTALDPVTIQALHGTVPVDPPVDPPADPPARPSEPAPTPPATPADPLVEAPTMDLARKRQTLRRSRIVRVASVTCGTGPCELTAPAKVRVRIAGKTYRLRVLAPDRIAAGATVAVRVKLTKAAARALRGRATKLRLAIAVEAAGETTTTRAAVTIRRG